MGKAFTITGEAEMKRKLLAVVGSTPAKIRAALYAETLVEMRESMRRTPVLMGALRASHVTLPAEQSGNSFTCTIQVGGPSAPYAEIVHENLDADHPNGQAKFLESTLRESAPYMASRVGARLDLDKS